MAIIGRANCLTGFEASLPRAHNSVDQEAQRSPEGQVLQSRTLD